MARLRIAPIVEGDGEYASIQNLLYRIWTKELLGESSEIDVIRPLRKPRGLLVKRESLLEIIREASIRLNYGSSQVDPSLILILLDADKECPAQLGPRLRAWAQEFDPRMDVVCVVANFEYETWFVASAQSLVNAGYLRLKEGETVPINPEEQGCRKKWIQDRFIRENKKTKYRETQDQLAMTRIIDLKVCRDASPSFAKLCRELQKRGRNHPLEVEVS